MTHVGSWNHVLGDHDGVKIGQIHSPPREGWQVGDAAFGQFSLDTCYRTAAVDFYLGFLHNETKLLQKSMFVNPNNVGWMFRGWRRCLRKLFTPKTGCCRQLTRCSIQQNKCVALTGRNTTGPPLRAAPWWVALHTRVLQTTTDASDSY